MKHIDEFMVINKIKQKKTNKNPDKKFYTPFYFWTNYFFNKK